jgi:hypothetical protein
MGSTESSPEEVKPNLKLGKQKQSQKPNVTINRGLPINVKSSEF